MQTAEKHPLHFLHIGKTGGTAIRHALEGTPSSKNFNFVMHGHKVTLEEIPIGEYVVMFLRDPVSRFASGFTSRFRKGQPRYHFPWTRSERTAFRHFKTPNELALALSSPDNQTKEIAVEAMNGINHVRSKYSFWLHDLDYLQSRLEDFYFVGFQESLNTDFDHLKRRLRLNADPVLPERDSVASHRTPSGIDMTLEPDSIENLKIWYKEDYELLSFLKQRQASINDRATAL